MALTKPRAYQIYDIDYKQATRVVTVTDITLTGGAPNNVDGVTLSLNDRVLVTGQSDPTQNGIYIITTLGSGANGTWARSNDTNATGELLAGTIVMVTEGIIYADTQWKLITDNPIDIGTTPLVFVQNYLANVLHAGNSNVTVYSNANVTITAAGTANVLTVAPDGVYVIGNVSATGNVAANYFIGNGSQLTGLNANEIVNGTSNVSIPSADGPITFAVAGAANTAVLGSGALNVQGVFSTTKNITANVDIAGNASAMMFGPVTIEPGSSISLPTDSTLYVYEEPNGNLTSNVNGQGYSMSNMGNILPLGNALYDLGSPTNQWRHLYVSNNSIYIGNVPLTASNNNSLQFGSNVIVTTDPVGNADTSIYGNIQVSGNIIGNSNVLATNASVAGNVLLGNRLNWTPNGVSAVYQVYNASTNSLDTIFG
jgi:hypothetical protein